MSDRSRVLVTGSRTWTNYQLIRDALNQAFLDLGKPYMTVVHGAARGADLMAHTIVNRSGRSGMVSEPHPAKWDIYGKRAGFVRNQLMVELGADLCLAFIEDGSKGATMCAQMAEHEGIPVRRYLLDSKTGDITLVRERDLRPTKGE